MARTNPERPEGRTRPLSDRVVLTLDGEELEAERGEPLAAALVAAGKRTIARSPKFHRPRGPACMRGACDGCLARVDGTPNVMTCMTPAADGMVVVSQNRLGPRDADLLR
jgi:sarcosine oxidase subunit alpha